MINKTTILNSFYFADENERIEVLNELNSLYKPQTKESEEDRISQIIDNKLNDFLSKLNNTKEVAEDERESEEA